MQFSPEVKICYSTAEIMEAAWKDEVWGLTVALTQPADEILMETTLDVIPDDKYTAEKTERGWKIVSNLHGYLYPSLTIKFVRGSNDEI